MNNLARCPSELELNDYLENRLGGERETRLLEHLADCPHCLSLVELAHQSKKAANEDRPTSGMIRQAKAIVRTKPKKTLSHYKWQISACISFILSFILTRYFLQFLALAVIFSIKWIFDTGSTRTLIMIYEAWRKKDKGRAQRIIRDFQDKLEERK
jgi:hypothetical protein